MQEDKLPKIKPPWKQDFFWNPEWQEREAKENCKKRSKQNEAASAAILHLLC